MQFDGGDGSATSCPYPTSERIDLVFAGFVRFYFAKDGFTVSMEVKK